MGYTGESDEEPDFYWNADVRGGTGDDDDNHEVNDERESIDE